MAAGFSELEDDLCPFAFRLGHLCSVDAELLRVTRGKLFLPSLHIWDVLLSERDMLFIDLSSWSRGLYAKRCGGFLRKVQGGNELPALAREWRGERNSWRDAAFVRLFRPDHKEPKPNDSQPKPDDVEALCARLHARFEPLHDDRDNYRAHRHERREAVTAKQLALGDLVDLLRTWQQVLGDLRCLSSNEAFAHLEVRPDPESSEARSVVDLLLCCTLSWIIDFGPGRMQAERPRYEQRRQDFFDRMHAAHEAAGEADAPFNEGRFQPDLTRL